jgi:hypothetical protein
MELRPNPKMGRLEELLQRDSAVVKRGTYEAVDNTILV